MSALPRPDLAAGPHHDLNDALHDLHHRAGWPSLRTLAREAGVSHTTVSKVFSTPALPGWGVLELLVEALDGNTHEFHDLWLAASVPTNGHAPAPPRIAGRTAELAAVRRHLESGTGLLLVTGEAGVGKTTVVNAAAQTTDSFVAVGHCLPLSSSLPLLPAAELLRSVLRQDHGRWFADALAASPAYVSGALAPMLPELDDTSAPKTDDGFARHRMFVAVGAALDALAAAHPLALALDDLHWADDSSLDLVEHLVTTGLPTPMVATWRTEDPGVGDDREEWRARLVRNPHVTELTIAPLTRAETAEQLRLASGTTPTEPTIDRIHALGQGLPLYTQHLASSSEGEVPDSLLDLLDLRLGQLGAPSWRVACALGLAQRSLPAITLQAVSGLSEKALQASLETLSRRKLIRSGVGDHVMLTHPLLAETIRRRVVPGEWSSVHGRLAEVLGDEADAEPGEVADHWLEAGRPAEELPWRVESARSAARRFAAREALDSWTRVLHLASLTDLPGDLEPWQVACAALDAADDVRDLASSQSLVRAALALDVRGDAARVQVLQRVGDHTCWLGDHEAGLRYLDEARRLVDTLPTAPDLIDVLITRIVNLSMVGRHDDVRADLRRALDLCESFQDARRKRRVLTWAAWFEMEAGNHQTASDLMREAVEVRPDEPDPVSDLYVAGNATDILLIAAAPGPTVERAARRALDLAIEWKLDRHPHTSVTRANVAQAYLHNGDLDRAEEVLGLSRQDEPSGDTAHVTLAAIQLRRGEVNRAMERCQASEAQIRSRGGGWAEGVPHLAEVALWAGQPEQGLALLERALELVLPTDNGRFAAPQVTMYARVRAHLLDAERASEDERRTSVRGQRERVHRATHDPFGPEAVGARVRAFALQWQLELDRAQESDDAARWGLCAAAWDRLAHPHDAAYCRWRAARAAIREGERVVASRLLARAARDARTHAPLLAAIRETQQAPA